MAGRVRRLSWTLLLCGLMSSNSSSADAQAAAINVMCATVNTLIAVTMPEGILSDVILAKAQRHADAARRRGASDEDFTQVLAALQSAFDTGDMTWEEMVDFGQECPDLEESSER